MIVHLFEPHSTYMEHDGFKYVEHGTAALVDEVRLRDRLRGHADRPKLLDALDTSRASAKTTTVVVMADHGEAFGAHIVAGKPAFFHGDNLYRELLNVPLMFRVPGAAPAKRDDVVQLIDMASHHRRPVRCRAPAELAGPQPRPGPRRQAARTAPGVLRDAPGSRMGSTRPSR